MKHLRSDPEIYEAVLGEIRRQQHVIELIASENIVSMAVLEAMGTPLTNKYSEGMPSKRYYGGNHFIDISENLAVQRAKKLFGADHANVQPHSGSSANMEAYFSVLNLHDKILGMSLAHGGHITHGLPISFSGKFYEFSHYGVDRETEQINYDEIREIAVRERPKLVVAGASAYPRQINFAKFREICDEIGAMLMVDMAHFAGLVAAKLHPDPIPYADIVTTTTHKTLRGPRGAMILCKEKYAKSVDKAVFPGMQGGPLDHVIAAKAVAFGEALQPAFKEYQQQILKNARTLADELSAHGFRLVSGGTDTHLILVDLSSKGISGQEAEIALDSVGICCNKNMIPFDPRKPMDPSGIRLGTPAVTTRGLKEEDMKQIAEWISRVLSNPASETIKKDIAGEVLTLTERYPIYPEFT